jgi:hypothetical protein
LSEGVNVENFSANLFFKVIETGFFRKQLPSGTFVFRYEKSPLGFSSTKDHLSSNTAGDCRLQLLIVPSSSSALYCMRIYKVHQ